MDLPFLGNRLEHKELSTELEAHRDADTINYLTQTDKQDF